MSLEKTVLAPLQSSVDLETKFLSFSLSHPVSPFRTSLDDLSESSVSLLRIRGCQSLSLEPVSTERLNSAWLHSPYPNTASLF